MVWVGKFLKLMMEPCLDNCHSTSQIYLVSSHFGLWLPSHAQAMVSNPTVVLWIIPRVLAEALALAHGLAQVLAEAPVHAQVWALAQPIVCALVWVFDSSPGPCVSFWLKHNFFPPVSMQFVGQISLPSQWKATQPCPYKPLVISHLPNCFLQPSVMIKHTSAVLTHDLLQMLVIAYSATSPQAQIESRQDSAHRCIWAACTNHPVIFCKLHFVSVFIVCTLLSAHEPVEVVAADVTIGGLLSAWLCSMSLSKCHIETELWPEYLEEHEGALYCIKTTTFLLESL